MHPSVWGCAGLLCFLVPRGAISVLGRCAQQLLTLSLRAQISLFSRSTACDAMDGSPPGSSAHGILQARILARVAVSVVIGSPEGWLLASQYKAPSGGFVDPVFSFSALVPFPFVSPSIWTFFSGA